MFTGHNHAPSTVPELYMHCLRSFLQHHYELGIIIIIPTGQMRKLMLEEVEKFAYGHAVTKDRVRIRSHAVRFQRPLFE